MRAVSFLSVTVCAWFLVAGQDINDMRNMPKYDSRYDYLDVDAILDSKRLVRNYVQCLINSQRCTPEGKALKSNSDEAEALQREIVELCGRPTKYNWLSLYSCGVAAGILPEALRTKCVRCTEKQKRTAVKVIKRIKYEYPDEWAKLSTKWDPTGDFTRYFEEFLAKDNFNSIYNNGNEAPSSTQPPPPPPPPSPPSTLPPPSEAAPPPAPTLPPVPLSSPAQAQPSTTVMAESRPPIILNRFGDEGELMMPSPSSAASTPQPSMMPPSSMRPVVSTMRPAMQTRPTPMTWTGAASDTMPTRFPLRPFNTQPTYTTAITFIDQIGYKIMRTTELVTDILRNTVRAVVG